MLWYKPHLFRIMVCYLNIMSLVYNHIQKHCFLHCHSQSETNLRLKFQLNLTAVTVWRLWLKWGQWVCMIVHVQLNYVSITIKQQSEHFLKLLISTIQNLFDKTKYFYFLIIYLKMLCSLLSLTPHYYPDELSAQIVWYSYVSLQGHHTLLTHFFMEIANIRHHLAMLSVTRPCFTALTQAFDIRCSNYIILGKSDN